MRRIVGGLVVGHDPLMSVALPEPTRDPAAVYFRDLGPIIVGHGEAARSPGGARLVAALALLLIHADRRVGTDALIEAMWGASATHRSTSTLDSHVWRLRRVLEPDRPSGAPSRVLQRDNAGYRLVVSTEQVDSLRFEQLTVEAGDLLAGGQPRRALRRTSDALGLWRGRPFTPVSDESWAAAAVARLEELHGQVREYHIEALLGVGEPQRALADLETALADHPLRERLWASRMLAYQSSGRIHDALRTFHEVRELFLDELGVEPGAVLQEAQARVLAADTPSSPSPARPPAPPVRHEPEIRLPMVRNRLIGRADELAALDASLSADQLVTLVGSTGCGKTRLAVEAARRAAGGFPDGVWFVDLVSATRGRVVDAVTSTLGVPAPAVGSGTDALRAFTRDRRMLLVLDNCEHVLDDAAALLDELLVSGTELSVLATSREPLDIDGERVFPITPLALPSTDPGADADPAPALELFLERLSTTAPGVERDARSSAWATSIVSALDGVPLALELAAGRARAYSLEEIAAQVRRDASALARVGRGHAAHHGTVRGAVDMSYRVLPVDEAALHRRMSVVSGPFTAALAAAVSDQDGAEDVLARLVHRSLLTPLGPFRPGGPSRFAQLAIVRGHAQHVGAAELGEAVVRRDRHVAALVEAQPRIGAPTSRAWYDAIDDDFAALRATLQHTLVDEPSAVGVRLASRLGMYWYFRGMNLEQMEWLRRALAVEDLAGPLDRFLLHLAVGSLLTMQSRADAGRPHLEAALASLHDLPVEDDLYLCDNLGVFTGPLYMSGHHDLVRAVSAAAAAVAERTEDGSLQSLADASRLLCDVVDDRPEPGLLNRCAAAYDEALHVENLYSAWIVSVVAMIELLGHGRGAEALTWSDRAIGACLQLGLQDNPIAVELRANALALTGEHREAVRLYAATRVAHARTGMRWPRDAGTQQLLDAATAALDRRDAELLRSEGAALRLPDLLRLP
jgi:predicted ATPase/DNA-binding SARP family transcriptional activator